MARVVVARAVGGPEQLEIIEQPLPERESGQVHVEVRATALNPADVKRLAGRFGQPTPPFRLGGEASGVVVEADDDATGPAGPIHVGDEVIVYPVSGALASELLVPAGSVLPKPATLSFEEAAGLLAVGVTAAHMIAATGVGPGDRVLVHGASGGVGVMALQLIREHGAMAIGTASEANAAVVRRYGGAPVAYGPGLAERVWEIWPAGPTAAFDCVGTDEALEVSAELIADRARIATIANFTLGRELGVKMLGGGPGVDPGTEIRQAARLELLRLAEQGRLESPVGAAFPLDDVRDAVARLATGHPGGKIIVVP